MVHFVVFEDFFAVNDWLILLVPGGMLGQFMKLMRFVCIGCDYRFVVVEIGRHVGSVHEAIAISVY